MLEATDADLNVAEDTSILVYLECGSNENVTVDRFTGITSTASGVSFATSSAPVSPPIVDRNEDGITSHNDVVATEDLAALGLAILSVDGTNGVMTIRCLGTHGTDDKNHLTADGDTIHLSYRKGVVDTSAAVTGLGSVKVVSDADPTGVLVRHEKTTANSGVFRGAVFLNSSASTTSTFRCLVSSFFCSISETTTTPPDITLTANGTWSAGDLRVNSVDAVTLSYVDGSSAAPITRTATILVNPSASPTATPTPTPTSHPFPA
ncbi:MAG: hypothetical protein FJ312_01180 [SAR202 cluster bacterium]|nr:hypothetical protein [SAR202 cluster bacterium]